jgi:hypothetical protein
MIPDDLDEADRNLYILKNGALVQKLSAINNFSRLFREYKERFRESILPFCLVLFFDQSIIQSESIPFQRDFANQLMEIIHLFPISKIQSILHVSKQLIFHRIEGILD